VRFNCPIFTYEFILESSGIVLDDATIPNLSQFSDSDSTQEDGVDSENEFKTKSSEELKKMLESALDNEQYEMASKIRDEINTRKES
jgi:excinuclease UvrABC helicase subunit UvrB